MTRLALVAVALIAIGCSGDPAELAARGDRLLEAGNPRGAVPWYSAAIELEPTAERHSDRGHAYALSGNDDSALADFNRALELDPNLAKAHYSRALLYLRRQEGSAALEDFDAALRLEPNHIDAWSKRGAVHAVMHHYSAAAYDLRRAIDLKPDNGAAMNDLAWLLATCPDDRFRNGPQAVHLALKACDLAGWSLPACDTLAAACAEAGMFERAVEIQTRNAQVAPAGPIKVNAEEKLALYQQGKPYRQSAPTSE